MGFFPVDEESCRYLLATGRTPEQVDAFRNYYQAQGLFGIPRPGDCDYTEVLELDLARVTAERRRPQAAAGPHRPARPEEAVPRPLLEARRRERLRQAGVGAGGTLPRDTRPLGRPRGRQPDAAQRQRRPRARHERLDRVGDGEQPSHAGPSRRRPTDPGRVDVGHGDVLIAAITSCTNTSNPSVMLAAGLLAKKAVERGLTVSPARQGLARARLARRHRVPREDRAAAVPRPPRLLPRRLRLHDLHRQLGPARRGHRGGRHEERPRHRERPLGQPQLRGARAPEHQGQLPDEPAARRRLRAGRPGRHRPVVRAARAGHARDGPCTCATSGRRRPRCRARCSPRSTPQPTAASTRTSPPPTRSGRRSRAPTARSTPGTRSPRTSRSRPSSRASASRPPPSPTSAARGRWRSSATRSRPTTSARPGRSRRPRPRASTSSPSASSPADFNSYGSRRGNDRVMTRGTFANVRIKNLMVPGVEGGVTVHQPGGRADGDLRRRHALPGRGRPARHLRRAGVRHRQLARLGRQGNAPPRRAGGRRAELRADPPLEPRRHGRSPAPVRRGSRTPLPSGSTARRPSTSRASAELCAPGRRSR